MTARQLWGRLRGLRVVVSRVASVQNDAIIAARLQFGGKGVQCVGLRHEGLGLGAKEVSELAGARAGVVPLGLYS